MVKTVKIKELVSIPLVFLNSIKNIHIKGQLTLFLSTKFNTHCFKYYVHTPAWHLMEVFEPKYTTRPSL